MSTAAPVAGRPSTGGRPSAGAWLATHPSAVLSVVLVALVLVTGAIEPNYFSVDGLRNTLLLAVPLALIAGGQTVAMLTGGIDLSVAITATGAAYVAGNQSPNGALTAILLGLAVGLVVGGYPGTISAR